MINHVNHLIHVKYHGEDKEEEPLHADIKLNAFSYIYENFKLYNWLTVLLKIFKNFFELNISLCDYKYYKLIV